MKIGVLQTLAGIGTLDAHGAIPINIIDIMNSLILKYNDAVSSGGGMELGIVQDDLKCLLGIVRHVNGVIIFDDEPVAQVIVVGENV